MRSEQGEVENKSSTVRMVSPKVAFLVPVGPLKRLGYQYHYEYVLNNFKEFADHIFLVSCSEEANEITFDSKLTLIDDILYEKDSSGKESYDIKRSVKAVNEATKKVKALGYDILIQVHINQYIGAEEYKNFKLVTEWVYKKKIPYYWYSINCQVLDKVSGTYAITPYILNLNYSPVPQFSDDSIGCDSSELARLKKTSNMNFENTFTVTDIVGAFTRKDWDDKYDYYIKKMRSQLGHKHSENDFEKIAEKQGNKMADLVYRLTESEMENEILDQYPADSMGEIISTGMKLNTDSIFSFKNAIKQKLLVLLRSSVFIRLNYLYYKFKC